MIVIRKRIKKKRRRCPFSPRSNRFCSTQSSSVRRIKTALMKSHLSKRPLVSSLDRNQRSNFQVWIVYVHASRLRFKIKLRTTIDMWISLKSAIKFQCYLDKRVLLLWKQRVRSNKVSQIFKLLNLSLHLHQR